MSDQINYLQRVGHSRCVRCDFETSDAMSFAEQDAALRKHLDEKHPGWLTDGAGQKQVCDLEQEIKEAAANDKDNGGALLFRADDIALLLAEKDAEIERLTRERDELYAVDAQSQEIVGKYMEDAESAERERVLEQQIEARELARRAFVSGAKWWEWEKTGATMWGSDQAKAWDVAPDKYPYELSNGLAASAPEKAQP